MVSPYSLVVNEYVNDIFGRTVDINLLRKFDGERKGGACWRWDIV